MLISLNSRSNKIIFSIIIVYINKTYSSNTTLSQTEELNINSYQNKTYLESFNLLNHGNSSYKEPKALNYTLKGLFIITFILAFFAFITFNNFVILILNKFGCFKNDSFCLFLNRKLVLDENEERKRKYRDDSINSTINKDLSNNLFILPLLDQNRINFYGISEESDENKNNSESKKYSMSDYSNLETNTNNLNSFRIKPSNKLKQDNELYYFYSDILKASNNEQKLDEIVYYDDPLEDLDKLEKELSKSLSELALLQKKLCNEKKESNDTISIENENNLSNKNESHRISIDDLTATLINDSNEIINIEDFSKNRARLSLNYQDEIKDNNRKYPRTPTPSTNNIYDDEKNF